MARDFYQNTMAAVQADGTLKALAGIQVFVYAPGTQNTVAIYSARSGAAQLSNPIVTDATGLVEFYADYGEYDVRFRDTNAVPRIADRTVQWNAINGSDNGTPTAKLAPDGGINLTELGADVLRQDVPIGGVISWFRPASSVPVPTGYEICDGHTMLQGTHDFPVAGSVVLPNLINKFILGADSTIADGTSPATGATAPGIRGAGGAHSVALATAELPAHSHGITDPGHTHGMQTISVPGSIGGAGFNVGTNGGYVNQTGGPASLIPANLAANGSVVGASTGITVNNAGGGSAHENRPAYYGLLPIMKVKRS